MGREEGGMGEVKEGGRGGMGGERGGMGREEEGWEVGKRRGGMGR
jgi:hypothetical protein